MKTIAFASALLLLLSCTNVQTKTDAATGEAPKGRSSFPVQPLQTGIGEEGWEGDIRLSIVEQWENDTARLYKALSTDEGRKVGLLMSIPKAKEGEKGFGKDIVLSSIGVESDYLLRILAELYKQKVDTTLRFIPSISVSYVNLQEFARAVAGEKGGAYTSPNQYKLFLESEGEEEYAEIYLNINPQEHGLELREKDEEYRPALLQFLCK
jgi:hypothetical protein